MFRVFDLFGENLPVDDADPPGRVAGGRGWSRADGPGGRPAGGRDAHRPGAALRQVAHRRAPRRRAPGRARHHHALRPGAAARRRCSASTTSIATRYGERDGVYTARIDGEFVWGQGKLPGRRRRGPTSTASPRRELRLLRQLLRRAAAQRGRPPGRRQPRSAHAAAGRWPGGGRRCYLDVPPGRAEAGRASSRSRRSCPFVRPELAPYARFDIDGIDHIPRDGPGHRRAPTTAATSTSLAIGFAVRQAGPAGALPRQEGGLRRAGRRRPGPGHGRHPGRAGHRLATSR